MTDTYNSEKTVKIIAMPNTNRKSNYVGGGLVLAALSALNTFLPPTAKAGFSGSKHDIFNGPESCYLCHTADGKSFVISQSYFGRLYDSPTMDAKVTSLSDLTVLCLSCHDGVMLPDIDVNIEIRAENSHPVSIDYNQSRSLDQGIKDTTLPLFEGRIECSTCHDVHNLSGYPKLLRMDNSGSEMCLDCHNK